MRTTGSGSSCATPELYLEGAEAPDEEFKDFENHVLHPRDGLWGGAPEKVRSWYHHVVEALSAEDWPTAVYCAGVLSHYYTDPLQPFHTAQSEAENNIHRAVEWSIARSYGALRALGVREAGDMVGDAEIELGTGPNWLIELVCRGAERATRHYEKLIAHYDIGRGVVDPPAGLDRVARRIVAEMLRYACLSFAAVLDRAVAEARVHAPETGLAAATLLAALQAPARMAANRSANAREWRAVEAIYDELQATGTVERHLPEEERRVRDRYAAEVLAQRAPGPQASQVFPFRPRERVVTRVDREREARRREAALAPGAVIPLRRPGEMVSASAIVPVAAASAHASGLPSSITRQPMLYVVPSPAARAPAGGERAAPQSRLADAGALAGEEERVAAPAPALEAREAVPPSSPRRARRAADGRGGEGDQLMLDDDIADGPIGGKTVKRLRALGLATVRDLLKADPEALAALIDARAGDRADRRRLAGPGVAHVRRAGPQGHARAIAGGGRLPLGRGHRRGGGREAVRRPDGLRRHARRPARAAQRGGAGYRAHQGVAGGGAAGAGGMRELRQHSRWAGWRSTLSSEACRLRP